MSRQASWASAGTFCLYFKSLRLLPLGRWHLIFLHAGQNNSANYFRWQWFPGVKMQGHDKNSCLSIIYCRFLYD